MSTPERRRKLDRPPRDPMPAKRKGRDLVAAAFLTLMRQHSDGIPVVITHYPRRD